MDERLLLPATPELLDGWCGPVVARDSTYALLGMEAAGSTWYALLGFFPGGSWRTPVKFVHLDLARAECRDRVARVLFGCPEYAVTDDDPGMEGVSGPRGLLLWADGRVYCSDAQAAAYFRGQHLPTMPSDWRDDTRLPDGSRIVDALALVAVAREVLR